MRKNVKNTLILALLYTFSISLGHAFDIDETVDDEIRKNYNPSQLIQDVQGKDSALDKKIKTDKAVTVSEDEKLPSLPEIAKYGNNKSASESKTKTDFSPTFKPYNGGTVKIKAGTTFYVKNIAAISDWQRRGTKLKFTSTTNVSGKGYTIPAGTVFYGEILESHQPQLSCNGGLIVLKIDSMIYKGTKVPLSAYVIRANDKKIFFNNIKGERTYLKTLWKQGNWGRVMFNKMTAVSIGLGADSSTLVLTPFPFLYGTLCLGVNTVVSPISALFSKGGHISIPANSNFKIKLTDETYIN